MLTTALYAKISKFIFPLLAYRAEENLDPLSSVCEKMKNMKNGFEKRCTHHIGVHYRHLIFE